MNTCYVCGSPLVWSGRGRPPTTYCSPKCKDAGINLKQRAARLAAVGERHCLVCDTVIPDSVTLKAKCCSPKCSEIYQNRKRAEAKRERKLASRQECAQCGGKIPEDRRAGSIYCSPTCKRKTNDIAWRARSPHYNRQRLYGITAEQYAAMLEAQDGRCAICRSADWPAARHPGVPQMDHDHVTGRNRELLCGSCNEGLERFADDPARLRAAAQYLEKHR